MSRGVTSYIHISRMRQKVEMLQNRLKQVRSKKRCSKQGDTKIFYDIVEGVSRRLAAEIVPVEKIY